MLKLDHKQLNVWKMSMDFVATVYNLTEGFPKHEQYGLTSQIRRASISVVSNVAEGAARSSSVERKRFFEIARSSLVEVDTQLEITIKLNLLKPEELQETSKQMNEIFAMLSKLKSRT